MPIVYPEDKQILGFLDYRYSYLHPPTPFFNTTDVRVLVVRDELGDGAQVCFPARFARPAQSTDDSYFAITQSNGVIP